MGKPGAGCAECGDQYWDLDVGDRCPGCNEPLVALLEPEQMTDPKDKALEAAANAIRKNVSEHGYNPELEARDAITAYLTAQPSDYTKLKTDAETSSGLMDFEAVTPKLVAAIEALEAKCLTQRRATTWYFEKMNEAEKRAEAAEQERDQLRERVAEWERLLKRSANTLEIYDRVHGELAGGTVWEKIDNGMIKGAEEISYNQWSAYMRQRLLNFLREYHLSKAARAAPEKQT